MIIVSVASARINTLRVWAQYNFAECLTNKRTDTVQFDYTNTENIAIHRISAIDDMDADESAALVDWMNDNETQLRKFMPAVPLLTDKKDEDKEPVSKAFVMLGEEVDYTKGARRCLALMTDQHTASIARGKATLTDQQKKDLEVLEMATKINEVAISNFCKDDPPTPHDERNWLDLFGSQEEAAAWRAIHELELSYLAMKMIDPDAGEDPPVPKGVKIKTEPGEKPPPSSRLEHGGKQPRSKLPTDPALSVVDCSDFMVFNAAKSRRRMKRGFCLANLNPTTSLATRSCRSPKKAAVLSALGGVSCESSESNAACGQSCTGRAGHSATT